MYIYIYMCIYVYLNIYIYIERERVVVLLGIPVFLSQASYHELFHQGW